MRVCNFYRLLTAQRGDRHGHDDPVIVAAFGPPAGKHGFSGNNQAVGQFLNFTAQSGDALGYGFQPVASLIRSRAAPVMEVMPGQRAAVTARIGTRSGI